MREHGHFHGAEESLQGTTVGNLMKNGLHKLYEHEYVQILFDEVLKPEMSVSIKPHGF